MNEQEIHSKIEQARKLVGGDASNPFSLIAFEVILRKLIDESESRGQSQAKPAITPDMQINEILASKELRSHMDRFEAIAWYFLRKGDNSVNSNDIFDAYAKARMQRPKNLTDVINQSAKRGHLIDSPEKKDERKAWCITRSGESYIEQLLRDSMQ